MENETKKLLDNKYSTTFFRLYRTDFQSFVYVVFVAPDLLIKISGDLGSAPPSKDSNIDRWANISVIHGRQQSQNEIKNLSTKYGIWEIDFLDEACFLADVAGYLHPLFRNQFFNFLQSLLNYEQYKTRQVL